MIALTILLFAAGHIVRDGWPSLRDLGVGRVINPTQAARILGALICTVGAWAVAPWWQFPLIGAAVLGGFYFDKKHGEGQQAQTPEDMGWLALSGVTSLLPLAAVLAWPTPWLVPVLMALGLVGKPLIWLGLWCIPALAKSSWAYPTRVSAAVFGALIGGVVCFA